MHWPPWPFGLTHPMHFLHLHPPRPWWFMSEKPPVCEAVLHAHEYGNWSRGQVGWVADYAGNVNLDQLVRAELTTLSQIAHQIVVMTPNWVCNGKYTNDYAIYTGPKYDEGLRMCADFVVERQANAGWPMLPPGKSAYEACRDGQLSGHGTLALEKRIRMAVKAAAASLNVSVSFVESTQMTRGQCNESRDGRHYSPKMVQRQLVALGQQTSDA